VAKFPTREVKGATNGAMAYAMREINDEAVIVIGRNTAVGWLPDQLQIQDAANSLKIWAHMREKGVGSAI